MKHEERSSALVGIANGERHPGSLEDASLRGLSSERESWPVRHPGTRVTGVVGASSPIAARTGDKGCPRVAKEGNAFRLRNAPAAHATHFGVSAPNQRVMVVRPSLGLSALAIRRR